MCADRNPYVVGVFLFKSTTEPKLVQPFPASKFASLTHPKENFVLISSDFRIITEDGAFSDTLCVFHL